MSESIRRAMLIILDGVGLGESEDNSGLSLANTPNLDVLLNDYPMSKIDASGNSVGLPEGQMGNSEVGHMVIGCGQIFKQDLVVINESIRDKSFFTNESLVNAIKVTKESENNLHLLGLASPGGVHSHIDHLYALIDLCNRYEVKPKLHLFTDGRDCSPESSLEYFEKLNHTLEKLGGEIYTISGRYFAMDRDLRWDRTEKCWNVIVNNKGNHAKDFREALKNSYKEGVTDEFLIPTYLENAKPLMKNDSLIFFNFRNDRTRQIARALNVERFDNFKRTNNNTAYSITTMTEYDPFLSCPVAFRLKPPQETIGSIVSKLGFKQFHCAETEKYPHVTFFINGGREEPYKGEKRVLVPSPDVATYDLKPEMSCQEVSTEVINALKNDEYKLIVVNYANGDMVGHTAKREAIIEAMECLDKNLGDVLKAALENNVATLVTADHGNVDEILDAEGNPNPKHSCNPVPCVVVDRLKKWKMSSSGGLSNIAPTMLDLMNIEKPTAMDRSLIDSD